jgi:hypothetical protein
MEVPLLYITATILKLERPTLGAFDIGKAEKAARHSCPECKPFNIPLYRNNNLDFSSVWNTNQMT